MVPLWNSGIFGEKKKGFDYNFQISCRGPSDFLHDQELFLILVFSFFYTPLSFHFSSNNMIFTIDLNDNFLLLLLLL